MALLAEKPIHLCRDHILLRIKYEGAPALPGQFVNIRTGRGTDPLLRRPFSVFNQGKDTLEIVVKVVGRGTGSLSRMEPGDIDMLGPLGSGFSLPRGERVLIAGGGVGNAPLYLLGKELRARGNSVFYIYGTRSRDYIYLEKEYCDLFQDILFTTDDGTAGCRGSVYEATKQIIHREHFTRIYACGPTGMMSALVDLAGTIPVEVSLENYFGCGIGLCMGCTVETRDGMKRACVDGPVMEGSSILWETLTSRC